MMRMAWGIGLVLLLGGAVAVPALGQTAAEVAAGGQSTPPSVRRGDTTLNQDTEEPRGPGKSAADRGPSTAGNSPIEGVKAPPAEAALPPCPSGVRPADGASCQ